MRTHGYRRVWLPTSIVMLLTSIVMWVPAIVVAESDAIDVAFGEGALAFSSGFIRRDLTPDGAVSRTADDKTILGKGDLVYLRMTKLGNVAPDELYTIYRRAQKVFHPADNRYLGDLIIAVGIVRITEISHEYAVAKVERSYGPIMPGNGVMPFTPPRKEESLPGRLLPDTPGMIVEMQAQHTLVAQRHRVYVDWGSEDGLAVGDQLEVFRVRVGLPNRPVGEVKIIALEEHTATGIIVRSTAPFSIGDRFIHKRIDQDAADRNGQVNHIGTTSAEAKAKVLTASLGAEIAKGGVRVRQEGDKVKISLDDLVDQLEYESGQAVIKPNGIKILKQISDILKTMMDQHIQVEGHTDSMRIGPGLITKFPTNQELSEARANLVVRFFMEEGVDPSSLSAVGYSDEKPVASNATEEGRRKNRRIEIELSPKQLPERVPAAAPFQP